MSVETENGIEVYENDIDLYLHEYENEKKISCYDINQMRWNSVLLYIFKNVFKHKTPPENIRHNCNSIIDYSDSDMINSICDYYINMCYEYGKEISIAGFSKLTGIHESTIYDWGNSNIRQYVYYDCDNNKINDFAAWRLNHQGEEYRQELSSSHSDIYKKLSNERETCLTAMTLQGNIGALAKGKIEKGWVEGQLLIRAEEGSRTSRTPEQIAADYPVSVQIEQKSQ